MICTVPGAKVGALAVGEAGDCAVVGVVEDERPTTRPTTTSTARTPATTAHTHPRPLRLGGGSEASCPSDDELAGGVAGGGARTGDDRTATPGPAGVVTSDQ